MKNERDWFEAGTMSDLATAGKRVVELAGRPILLLWNDGNPVAMNDTCIHRERSLSEGVLLNGRIVCPGHQWAFDLTDGYCKAREQYQPIHTVRVDGDNIRVALAYRTDDVPAQCVDVSVKLTQQ